MSTGTPLNEIRAHASPSQASEYIYQLSILGNLRKVLTVGRTVIVASPLASLLARLNPCFSTRIGSLRGQKHNRIPEESMPYLISRYGRSSHIVHSRNVSWNHTKNSLKIISGNDGKEKEEKGFHHSPLRVYLRTWGALLSLAEVFPTVSRLRAVGPIAHHSRFFDLLPLHRRPTENLVWEVRANWKTRESLATAVKEHDRKRLIATTWLDWGLSGPVDKKMAPSHAIAGDVDLVPAQDKGSCHL
jgi:hypothetical protein